MRPKRFQEWAIDALGTAPEVAQVEAWEEGTRRPYGIRVRFRTGAEFWLGISVTSPPGEDYSTPEKPVTGDPPAPVAVPDLHVNGTIAPSQAERHLAAVLNNAGSPEVARTYAYTEGQDSNVHPGLGVEFHSGGKAYLVFSYATRAQQARGQREFDLPAEV